MHAVVRRWLVRLAIAAAVFLVGVGVALLDVADVALNGFFPVGALCIVGAFGYLFFFGVRFVLQRLLWRVGRRLLVSYLLLGLVPLPLLFLLVFGSLWIGAGHVAALRADRELDRLVLELRNLVLEADAELAQGRGEEQAVLDGIATLMPGMELVHRNPRGEAWTTGSSDPDVLLPPGRVQLDLVAVGVVAERADLMVVERSTRGVTLARIPFEPVLQKLLESRTRLSLAFPGADDPYQEIDGVTVEDNNVRIGGSQDDNGVSLPAPVDPGVGGPFAWPVVFLVRSVQYPYIDWLAEDWHGALEPDDDQEFVYLLRTSVAREAVELAGEEGVRVNRELSLLSLGLLTALAISTSVLWFAAALLAAFLVWRIARATARLAMAFGKLEDGEFDHRAQLKGHDQLSELIRGYNRMAEHLESAVDERAAREAVDRELATARDLQKSLLPDADFAFAGLGIASYFEPAQAIGGDFYHFEGGESHLDVVVADVSGHGLGTGIVMAAAKTLLSALAAEQPETVELLERMDRQLRDNTEPRTFVTLVHCRFDLERGVVEITNAGHVPPYRVCSDGRVLAPPAGARPLGIGLPAEFHTQTVDLEEGDLWVLLSDGIVEAVSKSGEVLGFERWEAMLAATAGLGAEEARNLLLEGLGAFVGDRDQEDDLTLLVVRSGGTYPSEGKGSERTS